MFAAESYLILWIGNVLITLALAQCELGFADEFDFAHRFSFTPFQYSHLAFACVFHRKQCALPDILQNVATNALGGNNRHGLSLCRELRVPADKLQTWHHQLSTSFKVSHVTNLRSLHQRGPNSLRSGDSLVSSMSSTTFSEAATKSLQEDGFLDLNESEVGNLVLGMEQKGFQHLSLLSPYGLDYYKQYVVDHLVTNEMLSMAPV
jgi:hypothetical protein